MNKTQSIQEYRKEYYQKNKERLTQREQCVLCGKTVCRNAMITHMKSNSCKKRYETKAKKDREIENKNETTKDFVKGITEILNSDVDLSINEIALLMTICNKYLETL